MFLYRIGFGGVFFKKCGQFPGRTEHKNSELSMSHRFLRCFPTISGQHCADSPLFAHASVDFHVYLTSVQGWGGGRMRGGGGGC